MSRLDTMELAIVGLVGLLGYAVSANGKDPRMDEGPDDSPHEHPQGYPFGPGTSVQKALDADRAATVAKWEQSLQPMVTGVVSPNTKPGGPLPFYASERSQATNDDIKQRRLEMFTGALDAGLSQTGTYLRRSEMPTMFKPEESRGRVNSSGNSTIVDRAADAESRYIPSRTMNNVVPTQQVRVGPGVGVGSDVVASDGFHPMMRVMPTDFGWKTNQLPGGFVPGGSTIAARPNEPGFTTTAHPPRFWTQEQYPMGPGRSVLTGPTARSPDPGTGCNGKSHVVGSEYFGVAGGAIPDGTYTNSTLTRYRYDNNPGLPGTNVTGARDGMGGFVNATFDRSRLTGQRETPNDPGAGVVTGMRAPAADSAFLLQNTNRSMQGGTMCMGNPGSAVQGGQARPMDRAGRTLKEQIDVPYQLGVASGPVKAQRVTRTDKWLDRESKRYGQIIEGWMPAPCMASAASASIGAMPLRQRVEPPSIVRPTLSNAPARSSVGQLTVPSNKLGVDNTRLDLGMTRAQLAGNELAISVNR